MKKSARRPDFRRETVNSDEWEEFERWRRTRDLIDDEVGEVFRGWLDHSRYLKDENLWDESLEYLNKAVGRAASLVYLVRTGKKMRKKDYYDEVEEEEKPCLPMVTEVTIVEIGDGEL